LKRKMSKRSKPGKHERAMEKETGARTPDTAGTPAASSPAAEQESPMEKEAGAHGKLTVEAATPACTPVASKTNVPKPAVIRLMTDW
jgi:hypothetical protein